MRQKSGLLLDLSCAVPEDLVFRNGVLFGTIVRLTPKGVVVLLDEQLPPLKTTDFTPLTSDLKVYAVEINQFQVERGEFQIFAHPEVFPEPVRPAFPFDPAYWSEKGDRIPF